MCSLPLRANSHWYQEKVVTPKPESDSDLVPGFAAFIRDQIGLALLGITLKHEIDEALRTRNEELFREKAPCTSRSAGHVFGSCRSFGRIFTTDVETIYSPLLEVVKLRTVVHHRKVVSGSLQRL